MRKNVKSISFLIIFLSTIFSAHLSAQTDTVTVSSDILPGEGNLNNAVQTAINTGTLSKTVFKLEPNGYYVLSGTIIVPLNEHLTIVAPQPGQTQVTAPPQIVWTSNSINKDINFECYGQLTLKNVWLRFANVNGEQVGSEITIQDNTDPNAQEKATFDGVIFDYDPVPSLYHGGVVTIFADHFVGIFKNCYFKNCTDSHFRYYGRAVSFPYAYSGFHIDSLMFENCTFANIGYVFSQEPGNYSDYIWFNHCTFLNTAMFTLESGWWYWLSVTNSVFVNAFMLGYIPYEGIGIHGATVKIDSVLNLGFIGFPLPFTENDRHILFSNSSYFIEDWLRDWMQNNPYSQQLKMQHREDEIPVPQPMMNQRTIAFFNSLDYPYMNSFNLYDGTNPDFVLPPTNIDSLKVWLTYKWETNENANWAYKPENDFNRMWPFEEDLSYTNEELINAGMENFPLGDLYHWWPEQYELWKEQSDTENQNIYAWLATGTLILPVELTSFSAKVVGDKVNLSWVTVTEKNNVGFEIQRSINNKVFDKIGFIEGKGTTSEKHFYSYVDNVTGSKIYYRLKQKDFDGSFSYSDVIEVSSIPQNFGLFQNYPNPFNPSTRIKYSIPKKAYIYLKVYNLLGEEVATLFEGYKQAGNYEVVFDGSKLASGVYFYQLKVTSYGTQAGSFVETKKLIFIK